MVYRNPRVARREAVRTSVRARLRSVRSARRAVSHAKLTGVQDWSKQRMGRGPWPI